METKRIKKVVKEAVKGITIIHENKFLWSTSPAENKAGKVLAIKFPASRETSLMSYLHDSF